MNSCAGAIGCGPSSPSPRALADLDVEIAIADVRHPETLRGAFRGAHTVCHLAAQISIDADRDGRVHAINVRGARNAASAALDAGVRRYVHMSSVHAFDLAPTRGVIDESHHRPGPDRPAYDRSKAAGESSPPPRAGDAARTTSSPGSGSARPDSPELVHTRSNAVRRVPCDARS